MRLVLRGCSFALHYTSWFRDHSSRRLLQTCLSFLIQGLLFYFLSAAAMILSAAAPATPPIVAPTAVKVPVTTETP